MNSTFPHFLLVLTEALDMASGHIALSAEKSPILREWTHTQQNVMTFSDKISAQEAEQMFELVRSRYKFIVLSDPARPAKKGHI